MSHQLLLPLLLLPLLAATVSPTPASVAQPNGTVTAEGREFESETAAPTSATAAPFDESNGRRFFTLSLIASSSFRQLLINDKQNVTNFVMNLANDVNCKMSPLGIQVVLLDFNEWLKDESFVDETSAEISKKNLLPHNWLQRQSHMTLLLGAWKSKNLTGEWYWFLHSVRHLYLNTASVLVTRADPHKVSDVIAYVIGRALRLVPDASDNCWCSTAVCYVSPELNYTQISNESRAAWTNCSVAKWKSQQQLLDGWLMSEPPDTSYTLQRNISVCGNGIVEPGEQCDFAVGDNCRNPCCNSNCKLQLGATCAHGSCCDLTSCKPKHSGSVCRTKADRQCDVEEICDGVGAECPRDAKVRDGELCQEAGESARCFNGLCGTRSKWCRMLMGDEFSAGSDSCYDGNLNATTGFCSLELNTTGSEPVATQIPCQDKDKLCGRIYCKRGNQDCKAYNFLMRDLSWHLVPDGASCAYGGYCLNAVCVRDMRGFASALSSQRPVLLLMITVPLLVAAADF